MRHMHACKCIYIYIHTLSTWIDTYIHTHIHAYTHTHIHTYAHTHIHKYIHTYIHTYIRTYIHTYILISGRRCGVYLPIDDIFCVQAEDVVCIYLSTHAQCLHRAHWLLRNSAFRQRMWCVSTTKKERSTCSSTQVMHRECVLLLEHARACVLLLENVFSS